LDPDPYQAIAELQDSGAFAFSYVFSVGLALLLLAISALVSASEVALFSLTSQQIEPLEESPSDNMDKTLVDLLKSPRYVLSTILILNNLVNVALVTLSTFVMWDVLGTRESSGIAVILLTFITTSAIVFFGEITPKTVAYKNNLSLARRVAIPLKYMIMVFRPLSWILVNSSRIIENRIERKGYRISVDELNEALEITTGKETSQEEKSILKGIVNFGTISAKQIMRTRQDIAAVDIDLSFTELIKTVQEHGYSRIPVYKETIDKIEGVLYIKDLLPHIHLDDSFDWNTIIRQGYFIPESKKIDDLLRDFQEKRVHLAIVVDEYGGTSGIITMEDIIEEIVGDINDEFDEKENIKYARLDERTYVFEAKILLSDICEILGIEETVFDETRGEAESIGGLVLEIAQKLPKVGEKFVANTFTFTVVAADDKKINRIKVELPAL
jgi:gliding motility-associated protein GldE